MSFKHYVQNVRSNRIITYGNRLALFGPRVLLFILLQIMWLLQYFISHFKLLEILSWGKVFTEISGFPNLNTPYVSI